MKKAWFIAAVLLSGVALIGFRTNESEKETFRRTEEITRLRALGHWLLRSSGDSVSRVLPVSAIANGSFEIRFEKTFQPISDSIYQIAARELSIFPHFAVELRAEQTDELLYSFVVDRDDTESEVPCLSRFIPNDRYRLLVHLPGNNTRASFFSLPVANYVWAAVALLAITLLAIAYRRKKAAISEKEKSSDDANSNQIELGSISFDPHKQQLLVAGKEISLTAKETQLLSILAQNPNEIVERSRLQKEIWEDQGVIVTRSLDIFVSRLRKKMGPDSGLRILSVHNRGYRLEVDNLK